MSVQNKAEKLDVLVGDRGDRKDMAVRIRDLEPLLRRASKLKSAKVTAAPTADQYNALFEDMQAISDALEQIAKSIQTKIIR